MVSVGTDDDPDWDGDDDWAAAPAPVLVEGVSDPESVGGIHPCGLIPANCEVCKGEPARGGGGGREIGHA